MTRCPAYLVQPPTPSVGSGPQPLRGPPSPLSPQPVWPTFPIHDQVSLPSQGTGSERLQDWPTAAQHQTVGAGIGPALASTPEFSAWHGVPPQLFAETQLGTQAASNWPELGPLTTICVLSTTPWLPGAWEKPRSGKPCSGPGKQVPSPRQGLRHSVLLQAGSMGWGRAGPRGPVPAICWVPSLSRDAQIRGPCHPHPACVV